MLRKIHIEQLTIGMYIQELDCGWLAHPFLTSSFKVTNSSIIDKILASGIRRLVIDTSKGVDIAEIATRADADADASMEAAISGLMDENTIIEQKKSTDVSTEMGNAKKILEDAQLIIHNIMAGVRAEEIPSLQPAAPVIGRIAESLNRNPDALLSLGRIKQKESYIFQHSVTCGILMGAFARFLHVPIEKVPDYILGGILFDIGKARVPSSILLKPGNLTDAERSNMMEHVALGLEVLHAMEDIPQIAYNMTAHHHEHWDGSGYPFNLSGEQISIEGRMAGLIDVYDALTGNRPYKNCAEPALALKKILQWSGHHFDTRLAHQFIRSMGIYPVASLVQLDNGMVGVVLEQTSKLLRPCVRFFYDMSKKRFIKPHAADLSNIDDRYVNHKIVHTVNPADFQFNPYDFI